ncbi:MAG TPA: hypothetical protein DCX06_04635 [Opitutae bacterium]|nr:hypothetical protein [Opitutae bacterium]
MVDFSKKRVLLVFNKSSSSFPAYTWMIARDGLTDVDVLTPPTHPVRCSKWVIEAHAYETPEKFTLTLKGLLDSGRYDALHAIDESSRKLIFACREEDWLKPYLPFPEGSLLFDACGDKVLFQEWCESNEIPVPKAYRANDWNEVIERAMAMSYPFILKGAEGSRGVEVHLIRSQSELADVPRNSSIQKHWLLQQYIDGAVGYTSIIAKDGQLYGTSSCYKHVSLSGGLGPAAVLKYVANAELERIAQMVAEKSGLTGIGGFDWMEAAEGEYKIIDPHLGRGPVTAAVSCHVGIDLGRAYHRSLTGAAPEPFSTAGDRIVWVMPQMINILFDGRILEAIKKANPFSSNVSFFWYGKGDLRVFWKIAFPLFVGRARVLLGALRRRIYSSSK